MALQNLGDLWQRAGLVQRVMLLAVVLGSIAGAVFLFNWARQPSLALRYGGLGEQEAARIVEKCRDAGVAVELKEGGTAVFVPQDKVYSLRLTMASAGLPAGDNRGYQILDEQSFGASPFTERVRFRRAIEGELARSVQTLAAVAAARVHLVQPESGLFRKADQASASVVVKLQGGYELTSSNVAAIRHLIAGGAEAMEPSRVVVVDDHGNLLSGEADDGVSARTSSLFDQKRQEEERLARKAEQHLLAVLGPGRATVQVSVDMDMSTVETESKQVGPDKGLTVKETIQESKTSEPGTKGGAAGTTSDTTSDTEYEVPVKTERRTVLAGQIKSKSVSVFVDLTVPTPEGEGADTTPRKLPVLDEIKENIKNALGLRLAGEAAAAGAAAAAAEGTGTDTLTVTEASFYRPPATSELESEDQGLFTKDFLLEIARRSSLGLLVVGALLALRMFRGPKKKLASMGEGAPALAAAGQTVGGILPASGAQGSPDLLKAHITKALQDNPDEVKRLFLSWVETEKGAQ